MDYKALKQPEYSSHTSSPPQNQAAVHPGRLLGAYCIQGSLVESSRVQISLRCSSFLEAAMDQQAGSSGLVPTH